jgi:competence protein ComEC
MIVGIRPSLLRATVMVSLALLAVPLGRVVNIKNIFFVAAIIVLMIAPSDIFDVGFQLSFLGVWALISVVPIIEQALKHSDPGSDNRITKWGFARLISRKLSGVISGTLVGTVAVTLVTTPLIAYYFNYISLISLPANLAMAVGVPIVFADGILSAFVAHIPIISDILGVVGSIASSLLLGVVDYLGSMRFSAISIPSPGMAVLIGYYAILYAALSHKIKSYT